ncbi:MAG: YggT family protein [Scrofimicrobium sp.]
MVLVIIGSILQWASSLYVLVLLARVGFDWARILAPRWVPSDAVLWIADWVYRLTDPPLIWMRKYIPPLRLGNVALDVGFLVVFLGVTVIGRFGQFLQYMG